MNGNYKYNPEDFRVMLNLSDELITFYKLYEKYNKNKTQHNRFAFESIGKIYFSRLSTEKWRVF